MVYASFLRGITFEPQDSLTRILPYKNSIQGFCPYMENFRLEKKQILAYFTQ